MSDDDRIWSEKEWTTTDCGPDESRICVEDSAEEEEQSPQQWVRTVEVEGVEDFSGYYTNDGGKKRLKATTEEI